MRRARRYRTDAVRIDRNRIGGAMIAPARPARSIAWDIIPPDGGGRPRAARLSTPLG
jgi:hypothetical protein